MCPGRCSHLFCAECLVDYPGGQCPAPDCRVSAPAKDAISHKTIQQIVRSVFAIGELLCGDEVTMPAVLGIRDIFVRIRTSD